MFRKLSYYRGSPTIQIYIFRNQPTTIQQLSSWLSVTEASEEVPFKNNFYPGGVVWSHFDWFSDTRHYNAHLPRSLIICCGVYDWRPGPGLPSPDAGDIRFLCTIKFLHSIKFSLDSSLSLLCDISIIKCSVCVECPGLGVSRRDWFSLAVTDQTVRQSARTERRISRY